MLRTLKTLLSSRPEVLPSDAPNSHLSYQPETAVTGWFKYIPNNSHVAGPTPTGVDTLPIEILIEVFTLCLGREFPGGPKISHRRNIIMRVSKRWYSLVRHTPTFWSQVYSEDINLRLDLAVARSKPLPLDVFVEVKAFRHDNPLARQERFLKDVCKQLHRWRTADIDLAYELKFLKYLAAPAPLLETAKVRITTSWMRTGATSGFVDLFKGQASKIHTLHLRAVAIPWGSAILSGLQDLTIWDIHHHGPSVSEVITILIACPQLHSFIFDRVQATADLTPHRLPSAYLPTLNTFYLEHLSGPVTQQLLTHIRGTPRHALRFSFGEMSNIDADPVSLATCAIGCIPESITEGVMEMYADREFFSLCVNSPVGWHTLSFGGAPVSRLLEYLVPPLSCRFLSLPATLNLEGHVSDTAEEILNALSTFRITSIKTTWKGACYQEPDLKVLLHALGTPSVAGGVHRWRCPELRCLDMKIRSENRVDVKEMIEARYGVITRVMGAGAERDGEPTSTALEDRSDLPAPLVRLSVTDPGRDFGAGYSDFRSAVSVIVGSDKVSWY